MAAARPGAAPPPPPLLPLLLLLLLPGGRRALEACGPGTFKSKQGEGPCSPCPPNSRTTAGAATVCICRSGFFRADADPADSACTSVPSAPRSVISNVNETSLVLEWSEPQDAGGRDDLLYNVICKKCSVERRLCTRCDDNVEFVPRQLGLTERRIYISNLMAHTQYTFEIQAVNGISSKSPYPPHFASVNITTNQAGNSKQQEGSAATAEGLCTTCPHPWGSIAAVGIPEPCSP